MLCPGIDREYRNVIYITAFFRLIQFLAPLMNKPQEAYNWVLETDKIMSKVIQKFFNLLIDLDNKMKQKQNTDFIEFAGHEQCWKTLCLVEN